MSLKLKFDTKRRTVRWGTVYVINLSEALPTVSIGTETILINITTSILE
jgi:hypothetical protein